MKSISTIRRLRWAAVGIVAVVGMTYFGRHAARPSVARVPNREPTASRAEPAIGNAGLAIAPEQLELGEVWETSELACSLRLSNQASREFRIDDFVTDCSCTSIKPRAIVLQPGESHDIVVTIDLLKVKKSEPSREGTQASRGFAVWVVPRLIASSNANGRVEGWQLDGRVKSAFESMPTQIDFGRPSELAQPLSARTVQLKSRVPLAEVRVRIESEDFSVHSQPAAVIDCWELSVRPNRLLPAGSFQSTIKLRPRSKDGELLPEIPLTVTGEVRKDLQVLPEGGIAFGAHPVGRVAEETVSVRSLTGRPVDVVSITADAKSITIERVSPVESSYVVRQRITTAGRQHANLRIAVQSDGRQQLLHVPVTAHGLSSSRAGP